MSLWASPILSVGCSYLLIFWGVSKPRALYEENCTWNGTRAREFKKKILSIIYHPPNPYRFNAWFPILVTNWTHFGRNWRQNVTLQGDTVHKIQWKPVVRPPFILLSVYGSLMIALSGSSSPVLNRQLWEMPTQGIKLACVVAFSKENRK